MKGGRVLIELFRNEFLRLSIVYSLHEFRILHEYKRSWHGCAWRFDIRISCHANDDTLLHSVHHISCNHPLSQKGTNRLSFPILAITICAWLIVIIEILLAAVNK
jgi:hypothetical protein